MPVVAPNRKNALGVADLLPLQFDGGAGLEYERPWGIHEIFLPSDLGGRLRVGFGKRDAPDPGRRLFLHGSNGVDVELAAGEADAIVDFAPGKRGDGKCYATVLAPAGKYSIRAHFHEEGFARDGAEPLIPWNFWFYPYSASRKNETAWGSADVHPLVKYEKAFGVTGATEWERTKHGDPDGTRGAWEGHCHNGAPASILFVPPPEKGLEHNGVHFTCEELKFLATEFFGSFGVTSQEWRLPTVDARNRDTPLETTRPFDDPKAFGQGDVLPAFLTTLRKFIRDQGIALVMDLRDPEGGDHSQVWNHAVFRYKTTYAQMRDDLFVVDGRTTLFANQDEYPADGKSTGMPATVKIDGDGARPVSTLQDKRVVLEFRVRFRWTGGLTIASDDNAWWGVTVGSRKEHTFAPRWASHVVAPLPFRKPAADGNERIEPEHVLQLMHLRGAGL